MQCWLQRYHARIRTLGSSLVYIYIRRVDAVNILPLARFEPTTSAAPPSTTPDINATNCVTETSPIKWCKYFASGEIRTHDLGNNATNCATETSPLKGCSGSADIDDDWCSTRRILVLFQRKASISFASESLMDPRIQVKLDKYQKCGNII